MPDPPGLVVKNGTNRLPVFDRPGPSSSTHSSTLAGDEPGTRVQPTRTPPPVSAKKVGGVPAYKLARRHQPVILEPVEVEVYEFVLREIEGSLARVTVRCSAGTYLRSLAHELGQRLGVGAHVEALRRTRVGPFREGNAISLDALRSFEDSAAVLQHLLPVETALDDIPALALTDSEARRLQSGQAVSLLRKTDLQRIAGLNDGDTVLALGRGKPIALTRYAAGKVHPVRVLNL